MERPITVDCFVMVDCYEAAASSAAALLPQHRCVCKGVHKPPQMLPQQTQVPTQSQCALPKGVQHKTVCYQQAPQQIA